MCLQMIDVQLFHYSSFGSRHVVCACPQYTAMGMGVGAVFFPPTISSCKNSEIFF